MKRIFCMVLAVVMVVMSSFALAGTSTEGSTYSSGSGNADLTNIEPFLFDRYEHGIGFGDCPVYTAPSLDAYRCANGKAEVDTDYEIYVAGYDNGWLMVRYETVKGSVRVGYIPSTYISKSKFYTSMELHFVHIPQKAQGTIYVTDNPMTMMQNSSFARLSAGESYYILGKYTYYGNWWYIECTVDGKVARGFISRDDPNVPSGDEWPEVSPIGTTCIGTLRVIESNWLVRKNAGQGYDTVATVKYGEEYPAYAKKTGTNGNIWYYLYIDGIWGWSSANGFKFTQN